MKKSSFESKAYTLIPLVFSGFLCIGLIYLFWLKFESDNNFIILLREVAAIFIGLSITVAAILFSYIVFSVFTKHRGKISTDDLLTSLVNKMNKAQAIVEILVESKLWLPGVRDYMDVEFEGLTYFEVKEFYKGKSKLAIEYLQEKKGFNDTETLYLELKSLLLQDPKQKKIPNVLVFQKHYKKEILEKWIEHKCGSGLWYYFGYKFGDYKETLDIEAVFERQQDRIMMLANEMDSQVFEDSSFNEVFLSKMGEYINKQIIPQLFELETQRNSNRGMPNKIGSLYALFGLFLLAGIIAPLLLLLLSVAPFALAICYAFIISALFFAGTSVYVIFIGEKEN